MKKEWTLILCTCIIVIVLLIIQIPIRFRNNSSVSKPSSSNALSNFTANETSSQENSGIIAMASTTSTINKYTVKEYNGRIGLFYNDETEPKEIFDTDITTLPAEDQQKLKEGIVCNDKNSVYKIIEDYGS